MQSLNNGLKIEPYCKPKNAGISSQPRQVGTRIAHLLDSLDRINKNVLSGRLEDEAWHFKASLLQQLRHEGWRIKTQGDKWQVLPPK